MDEMETAGKIIGLVLLGAAGTIPVSVVAAMVMAPFKARDRRILAVSAAVSYLVVGLTIFS